MTVGKFLDINFHSESHGDFISSSIKVNGHSSHIESRGISDSNNIKIAIKFHLEKLVNSIWEHIKQEPSETTWEKERLE